MNLKSPRFLFLVIFILVLARVVRADTPAEKEPQTLHNWPLGWDHATDDWAGARSKLEDHGVAFSFTLVADWAKNLSGGVSTDGYNFGNLFNGAMVLDTQKLGGWAGGEVFALFQNEAGEFASADVGDVQVVDNLDADGRTQVAEIWYQQSLWDERVKLRIGKINANGDFAATANGVSFLNSSMGISPTVRGIPKYPDPAMGAQFWVEPNEHLYLGAGLFDGATQAGITTGDHAPTTLFGAPSDLFYIGEAGLKWDLAGGSLRGRAGVGGWHHTGDFARFDGAVDHGASGFYLVADQTIWREHPDDKEDGQGIGGFFQFGWADENVSPIAEHFGGGAIWTGAIPKRDADEIGMGVTCVVLSSKPGSGFDRSTETAIEWFYKCRLTPWAIIQPDLQYVINPGGLSTRDDSLVAMLRVVFDL